MFFGLAKKFFKNDMLIAEAAELYLQNQEGMIAENTMKIYKHTFRLLVAYFGDEYSVRSVGKLEAESFRSYLLSYKRYSKSNMSYRVDGKTLAASTVIRVIKNSRTLFAWLQELGEVDSNPFFKIKLPPEDPNPPNAISTEDFNKLIDEAQAGVWGRPYNEHYIIRDTAILLFLASTGCRACGIATAQLCDLDFDEAGGEVIVREKYRGGRKARTVFLTETAAIAVLEWLDVRPVTRSHDYIFTALVPPKRGNPMNEDAFSSMMRRLRLRVNKKAETDPNLKPIKSLVSTHPVRRRCAIEWNNNGMSDSKAAQLLGHTEETYRKNYARFKPEELRDSHRDNSWIEPED